MLICPLGLMADTTYQRFAERKMKTMFNATQYIIDKVRRITQINLATGLVDFTGTSVASPQIEFTGESTDKTDAQGILLARFDTAKGVTFSGELSLLNLSLMAAQLGSEVQVASESKMVTGADFTVLTVVDDGTNKTVTLKHEPKTVPAAVYTLSEDKNINGTIEIGTAEGNAQIDGKVITLPASFTGTMVGVYYEFETTSAVKLVDSAESFAEAAMYIVDVLAADVCNPSIKRAGKLVFPKAKIDNNFTVNLTTEGTHPFSFTALKDYCADDADLCYILFEE